MNLRVTEKEKTKQNLRDAIERLKIQYGTTYGYPIESIGAHVSISPNLQR